MLALIVTMYVSVWGRDIEHQHKLILCVWGGERHSLKLYLCEGWGDLLLVPSNMCMTRNGTGTHYCVCVCV